MSKEVIKKYKAEFDHWLDEGSILCRSKANLQESWNEIKEPLWLDIYLYIINDEYVEFRKAFADGKKIEFLDTVDYSWTTWEPSVGFGSHTGGYCIKPDEPNEPTFKVGDWVVYDNQPEYEIGQWNLKFEQSYILSDSKECYELWKPQPNEWCWFWDNNDSHRLLARYENALDSDGKHYYGYCEPFIGTLPTGCTK